MIQSSLTKFPASTFKDVVYEVQGFDSKLKSYEDQASSIAHLVFNTQQALPQQPYKNTAPSYNPNYRGRGRSNYTRGRGGYSSRGRGFSQHQSNTTSGGTGKRPTCQIYGRIGHSVLKCYNRFNNNYQSPAAFSSVRVDANGKEWYPDSGASAHVTATSENLEHVHPYEGDDVVIIGGGAYIPITMLVLQPSRQRQVISHSLMTWSVQIFRSLYYLSPNSVMTSSAECSLILTVSM